MSCILHLVPGYKITVKEDVDSIAADSMIHGSDRLIKVNVISPTNEKGPLWVNPRHIISAR